jgi:predicted small secreted protein
MKKQVRILVLVGFLILTTACGTLSGYGKDYKTIYAEELQLALGDYQISEGRKEVLEPDYPYGSEVRRMTWRVTYKDPDGKTMIFTLLNNVGFEPQIHDLSQGYLGNLVYESLKGDISAAMGFINYEQLRSLPITTENLALLPHYITFAALPDNVIIEIYPYQEADFDQIIERLKEFDQASFFVMMDSFKGRVLKKGVLLEGFFTYEEVLELSN